MTGGRRRPRFAMYWAAACGGCDIAVLNLDQGLVALADAVDIAFWPAAMDAKYADVEAMPDGSIDLTLFSGGIRNEENANLARLLRRKSRLLVAFGSCATEGCIPGLANLSTIEQLLEASFEGVTTDNPGHVVPAAASTVPEGELRLPLLEPTLRPLDRVVPVDYRVPGCPPETPRIAEVVDALLAGLVGEAPMPPSGSVLGAGPSTVCEECPRTRNVKRIAAFHRVHELPLIDPDLCLLEQGVPCNGPATREGCAARCPSAGAACIGCYGPAEGVVDFGSRLLSAFASVVDASEPDEIEAVLDGIVDPVGQFYRFSLAASLLGSSRAAREARTPAAVSSGDGR